MRVKEIMVREVKSITPDMNARQALELLERLQISGLPVIDEQKKLVGMFTEKEVLSYVLPSYIEKVGKFVYEQNPKAVRKKFAELSTMEVGQIMRREVVVVNEDTTLSEAARLMLTQRARRIPVLDNTKNVVGMVARCDVLKGLSREVSS